MRLANGFTAISNILAAYFIISAWKGWLPFPGFLVLSTISFYYGGMVLNDFFDQSRDALERPERPIPRGRISSRAAGSMGFYLLLCGWIFAAFQGIASATVAGLLALSILVYNRILKEGLSGSLMMGLCRYLNWFLGISFLFNATSSLQGIQSGLLLGHVPQVLQTILLIPVPIFLYVFSLTILSKEETEARRRWPLYVSISGLFLCAASVIVLYDAEVLRGWWGLVALASGLIYLIYRLFALSRDFRSGTIQSIIKMMVLGIIPLDALLVLSAGTDWMESVLAAVAVLLLLWPARALSGRFAVT